MQIYSFKFLVLLLSTTEIYAQGLDPVNNFCVRFDHQSTVLDDTLYIYGGSETYVPTQSGGSSRGPVTLGYNSNLIEVNLKESWDWNTNISEIQTQIAANPATGSTPVQAVRGALYRGPPNSASIYLYGGTTSYLNTSFPGWYPPLPATYSLWSYNTATKEWGQYDITENAPFRPSNGASADAPDQSLTFWFNGELDRGSAAATQSLGSTTTIALDGLVVINVTDHSARNLSTTVVNGDRPRTRGRMQYLSGIGERGILVLLGGSTFSSNNSGNSSTDELVDMTEIAIFDISSLYDSTTPNGIWYKQNATGQNETVVPSPRVDFCLVAASAMDNSSHNIYMYGGRDNSNNYFDEVWVLSIPSFTWTRIFQGESPRYSHTCHLVGNRTMLTLGGVRNSAQARGSVNNQEALCDWEEKGVGVLDMSSMIWGSVYDAHAPAYTVPQQLVATIGGSGEGGSTIKVPSAGFSEDGLTRLFSIKTENTKTQDSDSQSHKTAIIAAVCSIVGFTLFVAVIYFVLRRLRKKRAVNEPEPIEKSVLADSNDLPVLPRSTVAIPPATTPSNTMQASP